MPVWLDRIDEIIDLPGLSGIRDGRIRGLMSPSRQALTTHVEDPANRAIAETHVLTGVPTQTAFATGPERMTLLRPNTANRFRHPRFISARISARAATNRTHHV